jgi:hypothetical protein
MPRHRRSDDSEQAFRYHVDRFSIFQGRVAIEGWAFGTNAPAVTLELIVPRFEPVLIAGIGRPAPDVEDVHGPAAANSRFADSFAYPGTTDDLLHSWLRARTQDDRLFEVPVIDDGALAFDPAASLLTRSRALLAQREPGRLLELGSRARTGFSGRDLAPESWTYVGVDIMNGPNVDVVADAHELSRTIEPESIDAVVSFSVFEHLLMPWKVTIELNRVMRVDAIGIVTTHQTWPLHDEPWDFWRYSGHAWPALFNPATGFEILEVAMGEPAYVVPKICHRATAFGEHAEGRLASTVLIRKVATTDLSWPVRVEDAISTSYPTT